MGSQGRKGLERGDSVERHGRDALTDVVDWWVSCRIFVVVVVVVVGVVLVLVVLVTSRSSYLQVLLYLRGWQFTCNKVWNKKKKRHMKKDEYEIYSEYALYAEAAPPHIWAM